MRKFLRKFLSWWLIIPALAVLLIVLPSAFFFSEFFRDIEQSAIEPFSQVERSLASLGTSLQTAQSQLETIGEGVTKFGEDVDSLPSLNTDIPMRIDVPPIQVAPLEVTVPKIEKSVETRSAGGGSITVESVNVSSQNVLVAGGDISVPVPVVSVDLEERTLPTFNIPFLDVNISDQDQEIQVPDIQVPPIVMPDELNNLNGVVRDLIPVLGDLQTTLNNEVAEVSSSVSQAREDLNDIAIESQLLTQAAKERVGKWRDRFLWLGISVVVIVIILMILNEIRWRRMDRGELVNISLLDSLIDNFGLRKSKKEEDLSSADNTRRHRDYIIEDLLPMLGDLRDVLVKANKDFEKAQRYADTGDIPEPESNE